MGGKKGRKGWAKEADAFKAQLAGGASAGIDDAFARGSQALHEADERHAEALRQKACTSKKRYASRHEAEDTARECERHGSPKLSAYCCPHCGGWHLTHKVKR